MITTLRQTPLLRFITRTHYRKEITLVLILKLLALCAIWGICFSHGGKNGQVAQVTLRQQLLS